MRIKWYLVGSLALAMSMGISTSASISSYLTQQELLYQMLYKLNRIILKILQKKL